ncbi:radical SAM protein [Candidatus Epulonipiscium fishelsonii]|uniref:Radical SAM protein n=1 Tax=Candidatus Epulonipiscium fishelsonii TaxID=77094 RepID=A0ACC8XII8_9FIRM|nr:radical SAM protein [Epulopiscium sp. SCG-D08WGA-EpuloA1]OON98138.1 MAG: radical SAM protein [Epulopiscium sp. AS2M-Bin002]
MNIIYTIKNSLYINITNKCCCNCTFCLRNDNNGINYNESLWLEREPTIEEILSKLKEYDLNSYDEIVFCGFGEPLMRIDIVIEIATWIKKHTTTSIRINTNGLGSLIHKKDVPSMLTGLVEAISISLNAHNKEKYNQVTQPIYPEIAFESMLEFAKKCKKTVPNVQFSVVDVIGEEYIKQSQLLAEKLEIPLKVRKEI